MSRVYEVGYGPGYVRGTRRQVSRQLEALERRWLDEEWHLRDVTLGRGFWFPGGSRALRDQVITSAARRLGPDDEEHVGSIEWRWIGEAPNRPAVPWTVRADTDKAHRCPVAASGCTIMAEIERVGYPRSSWRTRWHVYTCAGCGQRFAKWPVPLLPELETGRRVFWERLIPHLRRHHWYLPRPLCLSLWALDLRDYQWGWWVIPEFLRAARRDARRGWLRAWRRLRPLPLDEPS